MISRSKGKGGLKAEVQKVELMPLTLRRPGMFI